MSHQHHDRPLGAFLAELRRQEIPCILIGATTAAPHPNSALWDPVRTKISSVSVFW